MGMRTCKQCKQTFDSKTHDCPHCGTHHKSSVGRIALAIVKWTAISSLGLIILGMFFGKEGEATQPATPATNTSATQEQPSEEQGCETNLECWADKNWAEADAYCQEPVQKLGKYTARWTDKALERKFDRYKWKDQQGGIITYAGDKIEFQNGFGAYQPHTYTCDFDTRKKAVLAVSASPGHF